MHRFTATIKSPSGVMFVFTLVLGGLGYLLYHNTRFFDYRSADHITAILGLKSWAIIWILGSIGITHLLRRWQGVHLAVVGAVSSYFVVFFGLQFLGTEFGWNAYWGDNSVCIAAVEKAMYHGPNSRDWYLHELPAFYPPFWFWIMAAWGKLLCLEAYQTVKFGYLLVFLLYPWALYYLWRRLTSRLTAAAIVVGTIFAAYFLIDVSPYEHLTAGLFLPWWLYYFEGASAEDDLSESPGRRLILGSLIGGCLFMTYYYWFFIAFAALLFSSARQFAASGCRAVLSDLRHKFVLMVGTAVVSAPYWLPLLVSIVRNGSESSQGIWFRIEHAHWTTSFSSLSVESVISIGGIIAAFLLWDRWNDKKLAMIFAGMVVVVLADRLFNMTGVSIQSRKIFDLLHVFCAAPLAIVIIDFWRTGAGRKARWGMIGIGLLLALALGDRQTEAYTSDYYRTAINSRKPTEQLAPFLQVDHKDQVFLTDQYEVACFLPICLFVPTGSAGMHPAGQYSQRVAFLGAIAKVSDPELFAYGLAYNRFDSVSYVFLPVDPTSRKMKLSLYQLRFNGPTEEVGIEFDADLSSRPDLFPSRHSRGLYQVEPPNRSAEMDKRVAQQAPDLALFLRD